MHVYLILDLMIQSMRKDCGNKFIMDLTNIIEAKILTGPFKGEDVLIL